MAYDKGLRSLGRRFYVEALRSAHNVQEDGFGAFVLAKMGIHVSTAGDTASRVRRIETAPAPLPTSSPWCLHLGFTHQQTRGRSPPRRHPSWRRSNPLAWMSLLGAHLRLVHLRYWNGRDGARDPQLTHRQQRRRSFQEAIPG